MSRPIKDKLGMTEIMNGQVDTKVGERINMFFFLGFNDNLMVGVVVDVVGAVGGGGRQVLLFVFLITFLHHHHYYYYYNVTRFSLDIYLFILMFSSSFFSSFSDY